MATSWLPGPLHPQPTRRNSFEYFFYTKHHGQDHSAIQGLSNMTRDEEFGVFELADFHDLSDDKGNLFGLRLDAQGAILELGTDGQQVAEFPVPQSLTPWHGYPLLPLKSRGRPRLASPKQALRKMLAAQILNDRQYRRLLGGKPV